MRTAFFYRWFPRLTFMVRKLEGMNDEPEMQLLDLLCDPAKTSVDVGAKMGMYTYRLLERSADVIAFEPIPHFSHMLRTVFRRRRCRVENVALSSEPGEAVLRMPFNRRGAPKFGRSTIEPENSLEEGDLANIDELVVETRTLDDYDLEAVGFVKIDVEGHEISVLEGAARTIERHQPNLLVEANDAHHPGAVPELARWLAERDYRGVFNAGGRLLDVDDFELERHADYENFLCFPRGRTDIVERVSERIASAAQ